MAALIKMPFGMLSRVEPGNHVLDRGADAVTGRGNFRGVYGVLQNIQNRILVLGKRVSCTKRLD